MKYPLWALVCGAFAVAFVWLCGFLLPARHEASASVRLKAAPEAVWAVLDAVEEYPLWRSDVAAVEVAALEAPPEASGAAPSPTAPSPIAPFLTWKQSDAKGRVAWHEASGTQSPAADKWVDRVVGGDASAKCERVFLLVLDQDGGTRLALTERKDLPDPLARFKARFVQGYAEDLKSLLEELRRRLGE